MSMTINGTSGLTFNDASTQNTAATGFGFKNRIINGAMMIDQRNAGASAAITTADTYRLDRWSIRSDATGLSGTIQQSSVAPAGFTNSIILSITTGGTIGSSDRGNLAQYIEGFNVADLGFGTASASTVTLSFWVRSSLTGTFSGALQNSAVNRSYVFTYAINSANTWEYKTVTISGDTAGTWVGATNGVGLRLWLDIGNGSSLRTSTTGSWQAGDLRGATGAVSLVANSGATFYITGVQLEKGSTATSFDYRPYTTELSLCQRYYVDLANNGGSTQNTFRAIGFGSTYNTTAGTYVVQVPVPMRVVPSLTQAGTMYLQNLGATSISSFAGPYSIAGTIVEGDFNMVGAVAANAPGILRWNNSATQKFAYSAEL